jgi:hypothetical protein
MAKIIQTAICPEFIDKIYFFRRGNLRNRNIRLWEKIFIYYIISKNEKELVSAVKNLLDIISNIE